MTPADKTPEALRTETERLLEMFCDPERREYEAHLRSLQSALDAALARVAEQQAHIDRLMLEFCPDEMTPEQKEEWGKRQVQIIDRIAAEVEKVIAARSAGEPSHE